MPHYVSPQGEKTRAKIMMLIAEYWNEHGMPPSIRDIGEPLGVSTSVVDHHLSVLARQERIIRVPLVARGILLPKRDE